MQQSGFRCNTHRIPENNLFSCACLQDGSIHCWLSQLPEFTASQGTQIAFVSSLQEALVIDVTAPQRPPCAVPLAAEGSRLALGPRHLAALADGQASADPIGA